MLLGEEVPLWAAGGERVDLLALARDGALVVVELKRGSEPRQLLQGIAYAAVIAKWSATKPAEMLAQLNKITIESAQSQIDEHLNPNVSMNSTQRVLLIAEAFDPIVLATAEWLVEKYGVELRCHRLALHRDGTNEYLTVSRIYPPEEALLPHPAPSPPPAYTTWEEALSNVQNENVRTFFLANGQPLADRQAFVQSRLISWRIKGKQRLSVRANVGDAYVWQQTRFADDVMFWQKRISDPSSVAPQAAGKALRFYVREAEDFRQLKEAAETILPTRTFVDMLSAEGFEPSYDQAAHEATADA